MDLDFFKREKWIGEGKIFIEEEEEEFPIVMKFTLKDGAEVSPIVEFTSSIHIDSSENIMESYYTLTANRKK